MITYSASASGNSEAESKGVEVGIGDCFVAYLTLNLIKRQ